MSRDIQHISQIIGISVILLLELSCTTLVFAANNHFGTLDEMISTTKITQGLDIQTNAAGFDMPYSANGSIIGRVALKINQ